MKKLSEAQTTELRSHIQKTLSGQYVHDMMNEMRTVLNNMEKSKCNKN